MTRILLITIICLSAFLNVTAQNDAIRVLEEEIQTAKGIDRITKRLELADLYLAKEEYKVASRLAEGAYQLAKFDQSSQLMAEALIRRGKANLLQGQNRKARQDFNESIKLLDDVADRNSKIENLQELKALAQLSEDRNTLDKIERELAAIQPPSSPGGSKASVSGDPNLPAIDIAAELKKTDEKLNQKLKSLNLEREALQQRIQAQADEIQAMTSEQMRQQLTLAKQQQLLDSLSLKGLRDSLDLAGQEIALQQQKTQRNLFLGIIGAAIIILVGMFTRFQGIKRYNNLLETKNHIIEEEKRRSDELLRNILPVAVANELKNKGKASARHYAEVTVLFLDFKDFSKISSRLSPDELVAELDACFQAIDRIIDHYHLEKIKTIGDAYMCAGGLPSPEPDHPKRMVQAAIDIQAFLTDWNAKRTVQGHLPFEARIGIHTGPIVAGVVGLKKFAYDIWGDTVNIAARMESSSQAYHINISQSTYNLVKEYFNFNYRGKVPVKNIGEIDMYFVEGIPEKTKIREEMEN